MPEASDQAATALLALWNDVDDALDAAYNVWHAKEHVPERLTVPGILWALRYERSNGSSMPRFLTLYGLRNAQVLESAEYQRLLDHPTPASRAMRPALNNISRWVCRLQVDEGIQPFASLAVRVVAATAPVALRRCEGALLVATRLPDAKALPWLAGGQSRALEGDRLEGLAHGAGEAHDWEQATEYARRPIG
jgi:hypothetical protein